MHELSRLQSWYAAQCNGDWEHSFGVHIDTLDNPGWIVTIDLAETNLAERKFDQLKRGSYKDGPDWMFCKVEAEQFVAAGGVNNLLEVIGIFLAWAES